MTDVFEKREVCRKMKLRLSAEELVKKLRLEGWEIDFCLDRGVYKRVEWEEKKT